MFFFLFIVFDFIFMEQVDTFNFARIRTPCVEKVSGFVGSADLGLLVLPFGFGAL